ncbi:hypothetical protein OAH34_01115 [bacterium]|nr:hypothetical protein [bacterium]
MLDRPFRQLLKTALADLLFASLVMVHTGFALESVMDWYQHQVIGDSIQWHTRMIESFLAFFAPGFDNGDTARDATSAYRMANVQWDGILMRPSLNSMMAI